MIRYRVTWTNERTLVAHSDDFDAGDDLEALEQARSLCHDHGIELWQAERRVARFKRGDAALNEFDRESL